MRTAKDAYSALFNVGPTGRLNLLLPLKEEGPRSIKRAVEDIFPDPNRGKVILIPGPSYGIEKILAIFTARMIRIGK